MAGWVLTQAGRRHSAASQVLLRPLFRVLHLLRIVLCAHAVIVNLTRYTRVAHPGPLIACLLAMVVWTAMCGFAYSRPGRRTTWWAVADVAVAGLLIAGSPWILGGELYGDTYITVPVYWSISAPMAVALVASATWATIAGVFVALTKVATRPSLNPLLWADVAVPVLAAAGVGMFVDLLLSSLAQRDEAFAETAALAERERLNRIVHDGVLQVLALVEREGPGFGPRGVRLASLARDQESRLRALLQDREVVADGGSRDLTSVLDRHASSTVTVSTMATEVDVPTALAEEIDAIVSEILTNVRKHAGPTAQAWVLLEQEGDEVIVSIRDNGVGTTREQLERGGEAGHIGIRRSVLGRVRDLGGQALVRTQPGRGVEWELRIPLT